MTSYIEHVGVIGMRWGHRKSNKIQGGEIAIRKGGVVHHISEKPEIILRDASFYTSFTKKDILHYRGRFGDQLLFARNVNKVFDHSFKAATDLITPTKKRAIDEMIELVGKDPEILNGLSKTKSRSNLILLMAKMFGAEKKRSEEYRRLATSNKRADKEKLFKEYMAYMLLDDNAQKKYFSQLQKKGFNSVYDFNDILNEVAQKPLIIFDAKEKILFKEKEMLTEKDTMKAIQEFYTLDTKK